MQFGVLVRGYTIPRPAAELPQVEELNRIGYVISLAKAIGYFVSRLKGDKEPIMTSCPGEICQKRAMKGSEISHSPVN